MHVINNPFTVKVKLRKTANFAAYSTLDVFDLAVVLPNKNVVYDDNITGYDSASYNTVVTSTSDGEITFNYTPTLKGVHKIILSTGVAENYVILGTLVLSVVTQTTETTMTVKLP